MLFWSLSPFFFMGTVRRIGPYATNLIRLACAFSLLAVLLGVYAAISPGSTRFPVPASWFWLVVSGILGLVAGDLVMYKSFTILGPERTSQILIVTPAVTAALAWMTMRESLSHLQLAGMALVLAGVSYATWHQRRLEPRESPAPKNLKAFVLSGIVPAVIAALILSVGNVTARQAYLADANLDPLVATVIRVGGAALAMLAYSRLRGPLWPVFARLREPGVFVRMTGGVLSGPVIGMICFVSAFKFAEAGVVTTITFMTPLIIIPLGAWRYGTRHSGRAILGTAASLIGVVLIGWV